jgi:hypothetical protein
VRQVQAAAASIASAPEPAKEMAATIKAKLPRRVTVDHVAGGIRAVHKLSEVMKAADQVAAHAKTPDGSGIRNPWLLLAASNLIRKGIETALRLKKATDEIDQVERFHAAIMGEVARESPECAQRILHRLDALATDFGG